MIFISYPQTNLSIFILESKSSLLLDLYFIIRFCEIIFFSYFINALYKNSIQTEKFMALIKAIN